MAENPTCDWTGASGTKYRYWVHSIDETYNATPANYIYAKIVQGKWVPVYIGETGDLSERTLDGHHQEDCIRRNGATHFHVHTSSKDRTVRLAEETDLRNNYATSCNDQ